MLVQGISDEEESDDEEDDDDDVGSGGKTANRGDANDDENDEARVPMMWSRELRTYVPINSDGNDAFWRSDA